jgi:hypothetical protein
MRFRPNALKAAVLVAESSQKENELDPLASNTGIMKMLVWLMAPVAMESLKHPIGYAEVGIHRS